MNYALGPFQPDREAVLTALVQQVALLSPRVLAQRLRESQAAGALDLLQTLGPHDPDRGWLESVCGTAQQLRDEGRDLVLVECAWVQGDAGDECAVVFLDRSRTDVVRPGDLVQAGVAIVHTPATGLVAVPRLFRKVCSNGMVLDIGCASGREIDPWQVEAAMRECLRDDGFAGAAARLHWAAHELVADGAELLAAARTHTAPSRLLPHWRRQADRSLWGLVNAATALAHTEALWSRRLACERDAERLLAAGLERGSPTAAAIAALH